MSRKKKQARRGAPASVKRSAPLPRRGTPVPVKARSRWRWIVWLVLAIGYATLMWYVVFPWVDRTFVNQPAL